MDSVFTWSSGNCHYCINGMMVCNLADTAGMLTMTCSGCVGLAWCLHQL